LFASLMMILSPVRGVQSCRTNRASQDPAIEAYTGSTMGTQKRPVYTQDSKAR